jgi:hypothetical protein
VQRNHLALTADSRLLIFKQEYIRRHSAQGISDQLLQSFVHRLGWVDCNT